ncbi:S-(hydroxymethyl)mycothiol dehydrogenase [subsurface metagenome]
MECTLVSENRITPISKDMPLDKAALLGCVVPTGMGAIINTAQVKLGSAVAVFGAGGIGLCAIQAAALMNAVIVIAIDIYEHKLRLARTFGATHTLDARKQDPVPAIRELTDGKGVDYAIEAAGLKQTMEQAFASVRNDGGLTVIIGNLPYQHKISIDPFALIEGKRIIGSWGGETNPDRDFPRYIDLYLTGRLKLDELITHRFQLEDINSAFSALDKGEVARAIVEF